MNCLKQSIKDIQKDDTEKGFGKIASQKSCCYFQERKTSDDLDQGKDIQQRKMNLLLLRLLLVKKPRLIQAYDKSPTASSEIDSL